MNADEYETQAHVRNERRQMAATALWVVAAIAACVAIAFFQVWADGLYVNWLVGP